MPAIAPTSGISGEDRLADRHDAARSSHRLVEPAHPPRAAFLSAQRHSRLHRRITVVQRQDAVQEQRGARYIRDGGDPCVDSRSVL
jgi:hypothetical protein